jgi:hypothetical protein
MKKNVAETSTATTAAGLRGVTERSGSRKNARPPHKRRQGRPKQPTPDGVEPILVDRDQAAALLGVSALTLTVWAQQGILKPVDLPSTRDRRPGDLRLRRVLYRVADLRRFAEEATARG